MGTGEPFWRCRLVVSPPKQAVQGGSFGNGRGNHSPLDIDWCNRGMAGRPHRQGRRVRSSRRYRNRNNRRVHRRLAIAEIRRQSWRGPRCCRRERHNRSYRFVVDFAPDQAGLTVRRARNSAPQGEQMATAMLYPGLELRIEMLAKRIVILRRKAARKNDLDCLDDLAMIERLDRRHRLLVDQLHRLKAGGSGRRQKAKAEMAKLIDDICASIEDSMMRLDRAMGRGKST